jgi:signal transduction histidine kinase
LELIKARESDRLKTNFLANISHEIRTPLNAIIGFASIVGDANDEFERDYYLNIINENSNQLLKLIDDIIDLSSLEVDKFEFKMRRLELKDICRSVYNMFSQKTKPEVSFIFDDNILPSVFLYTDFKRLHQVLSNLIDNAVKFTNKGNIRFGYEIQSEENTDKQFVRIYVEDTGIGIDKNYNHVLFDRFFKADNFTQGFGLGLPIAKKLTEEMGGELKFTSEIGCGSKFWIKIPILSNS